MYVKFISGLVSSARTGMLRIRPASHGAEHRRGHPKAGGKMMPAGGLEEVQRLAKLKNSILRRFMRQRKLSV